MSLLLITRADKSRPRHGDRYVGPAVPCVCHDKTTGHLSWLVSWRWKVERFKSSRHRLPQHIFLSNRVKMTSWVWDSSGNQCGNPTERHFDDLFAIDDNGLTAVDYQGVASGPLGADCDERCPLITKVTGEANLVVLDHELYGGFLGADRDRDGHVFTDATSRTEKLEHLELDERHVGALAKMSYKDRYKAGVMHCGGPGSTNVPRRVPGEESPPADQFELPGGRRLEDAPEELPPPKGSFERRNDSGRPPQEEPDGPMFESAGRASGTHTTEVMGTVGWAPAPMARPDSTFTPLLISDERARWLDE